MSMGTFLPPETKDKLLAEAVFVCLVPSSMHHHCYYLEGRAGRDKERAVCGAREARNLFSEEHWRTHLCFHGICTVVKHTLFSPVNKSATSVLNQCWNCLVKVVEWQYKISTQETISCVETCNECHRFRLLQVLFNRQLSSWVPGKNTVTS